MSKGMKEEFAALSEQSKQKVLNAMVVSVHDILLERMPCADAAKTAICAAITLLLTHHHECDGMSVADAKTEAFNSLLEIISGVEATMQVIVAEDGNYMGF